MAQATKPTFKTRIGNHKALLANVDQRCHAARRHRELVEAIEAELAELGPLTETDRLLIGLAASWQLQAESLTAAMVRGEAVNAEHISRAVNGAARTLERLRKHRAARKPAGPQSALQLLRAQREGDA